MSIRTTRSFLRRLVLSRSLYLAALLTLTGCLPYSCRREEPHAISPADSVSRRLAATITPDTLQLAWRSDGPEDAPLQFPRTVLFGPAGRLFVSDVEQSAVYVFADSDAVDHFTWDSLQVPYLAGFRNDTLLVFDPEARRLQFVVDGAPVRGFATPDDLPKGPLQYLTATDDAFYFKTVGKEFRGYVARLDEQGAIVERMPLPGPYWRYAGLLRPWGDSLLSLSGFQPVVDVLPPGGSLDTLALLGFDSPMLSRTYSYMHGDTRDAPLLTSAAAPAGDRLFVLNMRPGWLRIDVYDHAGRLQAILVQPHPGYNKQYFPQDIAARYANGAYELAVVMKDPSPQVEVYHWRVR